MNVIDHSKTIVLIIGVSDYPEDPTITSIPNVKANVRLLKASLINPESVGIPEANIHISLDENKTQIESRLYNIVEESCNKKNTLLIYYSGHGILSSIDYQLYLATYYTTRKYLESDGINMESFNKYIKRSLAGRKIVILDCCHSGAIIGSGGGLESRLQAELNQFEGTYVMTSSGEDEFAHSPVKSGDLPTYFTGKLIEIINEGLGNDKQFYSLQDIYNKIHSDFRSAGLPHPRQSNFKTADLLFFSRNTRYVENRSEDEVAWEIASNKNTKWGYIDFRRQFPSSQFSKLAKQKISDLEEDELWNIALNENSIFSFTDYLDKYQKGNFTTEANKKLSELRQIDEEKERLIEEQKRRRTEEDTYKKMLEEDAQRKRFEEQKKKIVWAESETQAQMVERDRRKMIKEESRKIIELEKKAQRTQADEQKRNKIEIRLKRKAKGERKASKKVEEIPRKNSDIVNCSVYAPPTAFPGQSIIIQVFAHLPAQNVLIKRQAIEIDETAKLRGTKTLEPIISGESKLTFNVAIPGVIVHEPVQNVLWRGRTECLQFEVSIPDDHKNDEIIGTIYVTEGTIPIGHIKFKIRIEAPSKPEQQITTEATLNSNWNRYRNAFISYASADRSEVLKRVQMLPRAGINFYQDLLTLEPGEKWEKALYICIDRADVFFLFWSNAAKQSKLVLQEVKYAINRARNDPSGNPEIIPILIEGPPPVSPPPELSHLHFNDKFIYFINPSSFNNWKNRLMRFLLKQFKKWFR